jgi:AcrR family transcriptional regulator
LTSQLFQSYDYIIHMNDTVDTKTRILDSAEKLFGLNGIEETSLRDITTHAQVNLAAVNYHFQSKDSLTDAVIARRVEPVNRRRLEMLEAAGPEATVEQILTAFLTPALEIRLECVLLMLGRILSNPLFVNRVYKRHFAVVTERFRVALGQALPDLSKQEVLWRQLFMVGTMTHLMALGQILPTITGGVCEISDRPMLVERVVRFLAAGFRAAGEEASTGNTAGKESQYARS